MIWIKMLRTFVSPSSTLMSSLSLSLVAGSTEGYGKQRAFGSLAWGVGSLVNGLLIDNLGMHSLFFFTYVLCLITLALVVLYVPAKKVLPSNKNSSSNFVPTSPRCRSHEHSSANVVEYSKLATNDTMHGYDVSETKPCIADVERREINHESDELLAEELMSGESQWDPPASNSVFYSNTASSRMQGVLSFCAYLWNVVLSTFQSTLMYYNALCIRGGRTIKVLLLNAFLYGVVMCTIDTYLYVSIEREYGASRTVSGLFTVISVSGTVPLFWYSDDLIKRYGVDAMIRASQAICLFRLALCALITTPSLFERDTALGVLAATQLLHGFAFAGFWACLVEVVTRLSSQHNLLNGCLAVINALYFTVGAAIGSVLWGYVYDNSVSGMHQVYVLAGCLLVGVIAMQHRIGSGINRVIYHMDESERL
jgi:predicted MFS family arabinose efflux permease